jgi:hypothetical protein
MGVREEPQGSFGEELIEDPEFEAELEDWQEKKSAAADARKDFKTVDGKIKGRILVREPEDGAVFRCGRFTLSVKSTEAAHREFDVNPSVRVKIKPTGE